MVGKKEFDIDDIGFVVVQTIKGKIKIDLENPNLFIDMDRDIRKAVKEYRRQITIRIKKRFGDKNCNNKSG